MGARQSAQLAREAGILSVPRTILRVRRPSVMRASPGQGLPRHIVVLEFHDVLQGAMVPVDLCPRGLLSLRRELRWYYPRPYSKISRATILASTLRSSRQASNVMETWTSRRAAAACPERAVSPDGSDAESSSRPRTPKAAMLMRSYPLQNAIDARFREETSLAVAKLPGEFQRRALRCGEREIDRALARARRDPIPVPPRRGPTSRTTGL